MPNFANAENRALKVASWHLETGGLLREQRELTPERRFGGVLVVLYLRARGCEKNASDVCVTEENIHLFLFFTGKNIVCFAKRTP